MKTRLQLLSGILLAVFLVTGATAHAAAALPTTAVWYTPANAAVGSAIVLNALVYNNQTTNASVTVTFTTPTATIGAVAETVPSETAKTLSLDWKLPATSTVVTASVTAATTPNDQSIPSLLGTIGTVTIGTVTSTTVVDGISFPGSAQISAWFAPLISKIEPFRIQEADTFAVQRDAIKAKVQMNAASAFSSPLNYLNLIYLTTAASLFGSQVLFYIVLILLILLLLRFIVNLLF